MGTSVSINYYWLCNSCLDYVLINDSYFAVYTIFLSIFWYLYPDLFH